MKKLTCLFNNDDEIIRLFRKWIQAEIYDGEKIWTLTRGIPQGSVVSPLMANLFLDELDELYMEFDKKVVRYADDLLVLCKCPDESDEILELTDMILDQLKLKINKAKTKPVSFDSGFKFLGAVFLHDDVYLPWPRKKKKEFSVSLPPPLTLKKYSFIFTSIS